MNALTKITETHLNGVVNLLKDTLAIVLSDEGANLNKEQLIVFNALFNIVEHNFKIIIGTEEKTGYVDWQLVFPDITLHILGNLELYEQFSAQHLHDLAVHMNDETYVFLQQVLQIIAKRIVWKVAFPNDHVFVKTLALSASETLKVFQSTKKQTINVGYNASHNAAKIDINTALCKGTIFVTADQANNKKLGQIWTQIISAFQPIDVFYTAFTYAWQTTLLHYGTADGDDQFGTTAELVSEFRKQKQQNYDNNRKEFYDEDDDWM